MTYDKISERYLKNYIRDDQLDRFVALGVITAAQAEEIRNTKNSSNFQSGGGHSDVVLHLPDDITLIIRDERGAAK